MNVNGIHKYLKELKEKTFDNYDIMTPKMDWYMFCLDSI